MAEKRREWSTVELAALEAVAGMTGMAAFHKFGELTDYSRDYNAFEVKRRRVVASSPAYRGVLDGPARAVAAPVVTGVPSRYIGPTVGYFDIETTFSTQPIMLYGAVADAFGNVEQFRKGEDIVDDKALVEAYGEALGKYDILVSWNGKLFDIPVLNARRVFHGLAPVQPNMHIDLMYYATGQFMRMGRKSLQSVSEYLDVPNRKTPLNVRTWDKAMAGDEAAYGKIIEHCDADCLVLRDVYNHLKVHVRNIHR